MATFQFSSHSVDLDFPGGLHWSLEMTKEAFDRYQSALESLEKNVKQNPQDYGALCDCLMDTIDQILDEDGAADRILGVKENYTVFDAMDVFKFISGEVSEEVDKTAASYSGKQILPSYDHSYLKLPGRMNRTQRRAAAMAGK